MTERKQLDLRNSNPRGRVDVLCANVIERFAEQTPELFPLVNEHREVIHRNLRKQLGPRALRRSIGVDTRELVKQAEPYLPILNSIFNAVVEHSKPVAGGKA
jgi:hypothetical protein